MNRITDFHGKTVATGRNLACVMRFAAKHPVDVVVVEAMPDQSYRVEFYFSNPHGAHFQTVTTWADSRVLVDWLAARRSWAVERITFIGEGLYLRHEAMRNAKAFRGTVLTWRVRNAAHGDR
jgi:hypothetical protein